MKIGLSCLFMVAIGASACGDDTGGTGGGAAGESVLGTTLEEGADEEATQRFYDACEDEGGILADFCQGSLGRWSGTCYPPPPTPAADEFTCDGLFNCPVGTVCATYDPVTDGCFEHSCDPIPTACADEPTCACLEEGDPSIASCAADDAGNVTVDRRAGPS